MLHSKLPQKLSGLKHLASLPGSMSQEFRRGWTYGFLTSLHTCQLGLHHLKDWTGLNDWHPKWFTHIVAQLVCLLVGSCTFAPQGCVTAVTTWWLASPRVSKSRSQSKCRKFLFDLSPLVLQFPINYIGINTGIPYSERGTHRAVDARRQGSLGAILEARYHRSPFVQHIRTECLLRTWGQSCEQNRHKSCICPSGYIQRKKHISKWRSERQHI